MGPAFATVLEVSLALAPARSDLDLTLLPTAINPSTLVAEHPWSLLAALVESCEDAIISKDLNGIITSWNPAASRLFGYQPQEVIGRSIRVLIPDELQGTEVEILAKIRAGQSIEHYETVRLAKNGQRLDLSLTISPVRDPDGRIIGASKIAHDISERKRADEAQARLAAIVESSEDAIVSKNLDGTVLSWNEGARRMFGFTPQELIGQSILKIIPPDLHHEEVDILRKVRVGEPIDHFETTRVAKDGAQVEVSLAISPLKDRNGKVIGTSQIARDISSRKKMERLLMQSEKIAATGRMAATIAHEINNPLEAVMNLVFLSRIGVEEGTDQHRYLRAAETELERISQIARTTLGFYRDRGKPLEAEIAELMDTSLLIYESRLNARRIKVERDYHPARAIVVSRGEIMQVFANIVANAIDAMPRGGTLHVRIEEVAGPAGPAIRVTVTDEGTGIEERNLPHIFEPFFTTKPAVGTGIGLWVTKRLLEGRGARIAITSSTTPGASGTAVVVEIPCASQQPAGDDPNDSAFEKLRHGNPE
jgi:PAS domain S-box-containing protein